MRQLMFVFCCWAASSYAQPVKSALKPLTILCVDLQSRPVPNAEVYLLQWEGSSLIYGSEFPIRKSGPYRTGGSGRVEFPVVEYGDGCYKRYIFACVSGKLAGGTYSQRDFWTARDDGGIVTISMSLTEPVRGRVKLAATGEIRSVTLTLLSWHMNDYRSSFFGALRRLDQPEPWPTLVQTQPDAEGNFVFTDIPQGARYYIAANAPGFGEAQCMDLQGTSRSATLVLEPETMIEGRVIDARTSHPLADVLVYARNDASMCVTHEFPTRSDSSGHYRIPGLPEGKYVVATRSGDLMTQPKEIETVAGKSAQVDLVLAPGITVIGKVTERDSEKPIARIGIAAVAENWGSEGLNSCGTAADGYYKMRLPSGQSKLYVCSGAADFQEDDQIRVIRIENGKVVSGSTDFKLTRKTAEVAKIDSDALPGICRGRVLDEAGKGISGVPICCSILSLRNQHSSTKSLGVSGSDGRYEFEIDTFSSCEIRVGGAATSVARSKPFETGSRTQHRIEDLTVYPANASVSIVVVDREDRPIPNAKISAGSENKNSSGLEEPMSDEAGRFELRHLLEDEPFTLVLSKSGFLEARFQDMPPTTRELRVVLDRMIEVGDSKK